MPKCIPDIHLSTFCLYTKVVQTVAANFYWNGRAEALLLKDGKQASRSKVLYREDKAIVDPFCKHCGIKQERRRKYGAGGLSPGNIFKTMSFRTPEKNVLQVSTKMCVVIGIFLLLWYKHIQKVT